MCKLCNFFWLFSACGRTLQDPSGEFGSPTASRDVQVCQWRISATHGEKIYLNITSLKIPTNTNCETDYLLVADGHFSRSPLMGRLRLCLSKLTTYFSDFMLTNERNSKRWRLLHCHQYIKSSLCNSTLMYCIQLQVSSVGKHLHPPLYHQRVECG